jgi:hypothetical protein
LVFEDGWVICESRRNDREHGERGEVFQFHVGVDLAVLLFFRSGCLEGFRGYLTPSP